MPPPNTELLLALAARCEREEPSAMLDWAIHEVLGLIGHSLAYTTSLDAAVTLVPKGWCIAELSDDGAGFAGNFVITGCTVMLERDDDMIVQATTKTRAMALCAAALKARAALA